MCFFGGGGGGYTLYDWYFVDTIARRNNVIRKICQLHELKEAPITWLGPHIALVIQMLFLLTGVNFSFTEIIP